MSDEERCLTYLFDRVDDVFLLIEGRIYGHILFQRLSFGDKFVLLEHSLR